MTRLNRKRTPAAASRPRTRTAPRPRTRAQQKVDTRERIRAAAWELFTTRGFDETTTKAVARKAGVAAGTVFVHASDKDDLLFLVMCDRISTTVDAAFDTLPDGPLLERLLHVFGKLFDMYSANPGVAAAFVARQPNGKGPNAQRVNALTFAFLHRLASLVVDAQSRGEASREIDPHVAAQNFFALYFMALMTWISGLGTLASALDPILRSALALQLRGLRP